MFMWPRYDFTSEAGWVESQPPPNARGTTALAPRERGSSMDRIIMWLTVASLAIAFASFLRDLLAQ